jgi:hypothetical protein
VQFAAEVVALVVLEEQPGKHAVAAAIEMAAEKPMVRANALMA